MTEPYLNMVKAPSGGLNRGHIILLADTNKLTKYAFQGGYVQTFSSYKQRDSNSQDLQAYMELTNILEGWDILQKNCNWTLY